MNVDLTTFIGFQKRYENGTRRYENGINVDLTQFVAFQKRYDTSSVCLISNK